MGVQGQSQDEWHYKKAQGVPSDKRTYTRDKLLRYLFPIAKLTNVRSLLVASKHWFLDQLDVDKDFLLGDIIRESYMEPLPSLNILEKGQLYKLTKSLYGLK